MTKINIYLISYKRDDSADKKIERKLTNAINKALNR